MLDAIIIDDECKSIENLKSLLNKYCSTINIIASTTNIEDAVNIIRETKPCIVFLDVQLSQQTGFELLKRITNPTFEVIFVTGYSQYAIEAIRLSAIDYLLKPININELVHAVEKATQNILQKRKNERLENLTNYFTSGIQKIAIPSNKETIFIDPKTIIFCKSDNNYTLFFLQNNMKHVSSKPIFEYEELLKNYGFVRCHQSYLINCQHIKSWIKMNGDRLLMEGNTEIPISRNSREKLKLAIGLK